MSQQEDLTTTFERLIKVAESNRAQETYKKCHADFVRCHISANRSWLTHVSFATSCHEVYNRCVVVYTDHANALSLWIQNHPQNK